jgi:hypothetical protein
MAAIVLEAVPSLCEFLGIRTAPTLCRIHALQVYAPQNFFPTLSDELLEFRYRFYVRNVHVLDSEIYDIF